MKTIEEIRRDNLKTLILESGGNAAKFSRSVDKKPNQIHQWVHATPDSKSGRPRAMSFDIARYLEWKCNKPNAWMDQEHRGDFTERYNSAPELAQELFDKIIELKPDAIKKAMKIIDLLISDEINDDSKGEINKNNTDRRTLHQTIPKDIDRRNKHGKNL